MATWTYKILTSKAAKSYADLSLVLHDLEHIKLCCQEILKSGQHPLICHVSHALFDSAVVRYRRCFGSGLRTNLSKLLSRLTPAEKELHEFIVTLVNKHTAHSENGCESASARLYISMSEGGELSRGSFGGGGQRTLELSLYDMEALSDLVERLIGFTKEWRKEIEGRLAKEVGQMTDEQILQLADDEPLPRSIDVSRPRSWP